MKHINSDKMLEQWQDFQKKESYWPQRRTGQKRFRLLSRQILIEVIKKRTLSNGDLTALVQMLKWRCTEECFLKYLDRLNLPLRATVDIQRKYKCLPRIQVGKNNMIKSCGFTAVGLAKIKGLTTAHRAHIRTFLKSVAGSKSPKDIMVAVAVYERHSVPIVHAGIYSPWIHALKPNICPLVNNAVRPILKASCWSGSYVDAVTFYARTSRILQQSDLVETDRFLCHICEDEKRSYMLRKHFFDSYDDPEDEKEEHLYAGELPTVASGREGERRQVSVALIERDPKLRLACMQKYGTNCAACGLNFGKTYGKWADGFIHIHHLKPLSETRKPVTTTVRNLRPVCPNCHAMLHRGNKLMTINRLIEEIKKAKRVQGQV